MVDGSKLTASNNEYILSGKTGSVTIKYKIKMAGLAGYELPSNMPDDYFEVTISYIGAGPTITSTAFENIQEIGIWK